MSLKISDYVEVLEGKSKGKIGQIVDKPPLSNWYHVAIPGHKLPVVTTCGDRLKKVEEEF